MKVLKDWPNVERIKRNFLLIHLSAKGVLADVYGIINDILSHIKTHICAVTNTGWERSRWGFSTLKS
jgi:hypothetical protein